MIQTCPAHDQRFDDSEGACPSCERASIAKGYTAMTSVKSTNTDTPETDAVWKRVREDMQHPGDADELLEHTSKLERQRDEAVDALKFAVECIEEAVRYSALHNGYEYNFKPAVDKARAFLSAREVKS